MQADRNLLFGVLALQLDLVTQSQLVSGMQAWAGEKQTSLSAHLQRLGFLQPESAALLEPLVARHIVEHGNDPAQSLAVLSSVAPIAAALGPLARQDEEIAASIGHFKPAAPPASEAGAVGQTTVATPLFANEKGRFRILRPHAEGGLGKVSVAQDGELGREVALKEIKAAYADDGHSRGRFVLEAEITGGLEHPGIVPVYGLGTYADGRPFYAMRFIQGDSLKERIDRFHGRTPGATAPVSESARNLELRELLGRFVDVCQAVAYAHSRGVLHRDLKPDNIMLGKYGETLVVDWGLAKARGKDFPSVDSPLVPASQSGSGVLGASGSNVEPTQAGSVLGTLAYMSPEQAAGKVDELGATTDVYSLGATLYHLLTGRAPFAHWTKEIDQGQRLRDIQAGRFPRPREVSPQIPAALEAVCLKAMATAPAARYGALGDLTADIEHWLADEPVAAFREPLSRRAARWTRKHPAIVAGGFSTVLVASLALVALTVVTRQKNTELKLSNGRERKATAEATKQAGIAKARQKEAETHAANAKKQSELALQTLNSVVFNLSRSLENVPGGGGVRRQLLQTSLAQLDQIAAQYVGEAKADHTSAAALIDLADSILRFGDEPLDEFSNRRATNGTYSDLDEDAVLIALRLYRSSHGILVKLAAATPKDAVAQHNLFLSYARLSDVLLRGGDVEAAKEANVECLAISKKRAAAVPNDAQAQRDMWISYLQLGDLLLRTGDVEAGAEAYDKGLRIAVKLAADDIADGQAQRDLSAAYQKRGNVLLQLGDLEAASASYRQSLKVLENLAAATPNDPVVQQSLSVSYNTMGEVSLQRGDVAAARELFGQSLMIRKKLAADDPTDAIAQRDLSRSYISLGDLSLRTGDVTTALEAYRQSLEISKERAASTPNDARVQVNLAVSYSKVGDVLLQTGDGVAARESFIQSLAILKKLAEAAPNDAQVQVNLSSSYQKLGELARKTGDVEAARESFIQSLAICKRLAELSPTDAQVQRDLSIAYHDLGVVALQTGDVETARESFGQSLVVQKKLAADDPTDGQAQRDLAISYQTQSDVLLQTGDVEAANEAISQSFLIFEELAANEPTDTRAQRDLSISYNKVGDMSKLKGDLNAARDIFFRSLAIVKKLAANDLTDGQAQRDLMIGHYKIGQLEKAAFRFDLAATQFKQGHAVLLNFMERQGRQSFASELTGLQQEVALCAHAEQVIADLDAVKTAPAEVVVELLYIRVKVFLQRARETPENLVPLLAEATRSAERLAVVGDAESRANNQYDSACCYALCVAEVDAAKAREAAANMTGPAHSPEAAKARETYQTAALAALRSAIKAGFNDAVQIAKDPQLDVLRKLPEFQEIVKTIKEE